MNLKPEIPLTCEEFEALLASYLDGTLSEGARRDAETHATQCPRCSALVADLAEIRIDAARLPVLKPSHDLWEGIAARIETPAISLDTHRAAQPWHARARMAAAAVVLITATAGVTWKLAQQRFQAAAPDTATMAPMTAGTTQATLTSNIIAEYDGEIARLRTMLANRPRALDSATAQVLATNLQVIDDAIARVRVALDSMPTSALLSQQLMRAYDMKLNALRQVAALTTE